MTSTNQKNSIRLFPTSNSHIQPASRAEGKRQRAEGKNLSGIVRRALWRTDALRVGVALSRTSSPPVKARRVKVFVG